MRKAISIIFLVLIADQVLKFWVKTNFGLGDEFSVLGMDWFRIHFTENPGMAFGLEIGGDRGKLFLSIFRIIAVIGISYYLWMLIKQKVHTGLIISISLILAGALGNITDSAFYGLIFDKGLSYSPDSNRWEYYSGIAGLASSGYAGFLNGCVVDMLYFPLIDGFAPDWFPSRPSQPVWIPDFLFNAMPWANERFIFFRPVFNIADSAITAGVLLIVLFQRKFFPVAKEMEELPEGQEVPETAES